MRKKSQSFLFDLLSTPSPSGDEANIQRKWASYVKPYADSIDVDTMGNTAAVLNPDMNKTILLAGHCDEIGFMVTEIDDNGYVYFSKVGGISHKIAPGMCVEILTKKGSVNGVVGVRAKHHGGLKDKFEFKDLFIDCGAKSDKQIGEKVSRGDFIVYRRAPELLMNDRLAGRGLDNRTGAFIVAELVRRLSGKKLNVTVRAVSTVSEEIGLHGAYFAGAGANPDMAIACDVTFSTDHPGVDKKKHGNIKLGKGPVLAKGSPINRKINTLLEKAAKSRKIPLQYELTPSGTGTDADRIRFTGKGVPVALVSLPLRYMHAPVETASMKDIENEISLLSTMILNLDGKEDLSPFKL